MGAGKIVGGIISLIFGIIIFTASLLFYNIQTSNLNYCNGLVGGLQQGLDAQAAEVCSNAGRIIAGAIGGMILGGALALIGLILVIVGTVQPGSKEQKVVLQKSDQFSEEQYKSNPHPTKTVETTYCRYCGKTKSLSADYCASCGKSSSTSSIGMKLCKCVSLMAEDSIFCSACGRMFPSWSSVEKSSEMDKNATGTLQKRDLPEPIVQVHERKEEGSIIQQPNTTSERNGSLQTFEETRFGIRMQYPLSWNRKVTKQLILFYPPMQKESEDSGFWIMFGYTKLTLHDYLKERITIISANDEYFKLLESSTDVKLSGEPAYKLVYIRRSNDRTLVKRMEFGTIIDGKACVVNGDSETISYSKYLPAIEKMISSIELKKIG